MQIYKIHFSFQATQGSTVKLTSMSATLTLATMEPARMVLLPSPATAVLATLAACVRPTSMNVLASRVRMAALVRTGRTHIFVPAQKALQVRHKQLSNSEPSS